MTDIVQFGTSRFLQAHADLFFTEAQNPRRVTVVQTSGDAARAARLNALARADGFPVRIRGLFDGQTIDETRRVTSVENTLSTATEWNEVASAVGVARALISNTGDAGFDPKPPDTDDLPSQAMSFPGKLRHLLRARFEAGGDPLPIYPLELVASNGPVLRERTLQLAAPDAPEFRRWLKSCIWAESLVDRIVSEPIEPAGAVAEPYALWAIQNQPGLAAPAMHPAIQMTDNLESIARLKLHILNLGHTVLAQSWIEQGRPHGMVVRDYIDSKAGAEMMSVMTNEVLPGFAAHGMADESRDYLAATMERFANPFLDHQISDIAQNHAQKVNRRIGGFVDWAQKADPMFHAPRLFRLLGASHQ